MNEIKNVIVKPVLTEKATVEMEKNNRYAFIVKPNANKNQIKNAIEKFFNVKVEKINTTTCAGKTKRSGKSTKKLSSVKKAYVQIKNGQKIEFFKNI
ncbi:MAG: 50S ribosomal protein L23 [Bacteriovoracaceae bacterium]